MKKSVLIMFHLLFWIFTSLLVILVFQLMSITASVLGGGGPGIKDNLAFLLIILPIGASVFYASYFSLNFFVKRPTRFIWLAIGYAIFTLVFLVPAIVADLKSSRDPDFLESLFVFFPVLYFNVFGFLFKTFIEWIKDKKVKAELEKDKIASQLELLKSKLNPHFLFNTLNNIDVLIQEEPNKASEYLKKLSEILRFMLYESNIDKIPLSKEIEYIRKYIDLQKIRTTNPDFVKFEITGDPNGKIVAPMIFIHFIENAFKFASNKKIENAVNIKFEISDNRLSFFCNNHKNSSDETNPEKNGLGIHLIMQKLDLIYKKNYNLHINDEADWYNVNLEIQFDEH
jgi:two-component system, LytTR family, sensor kinase